MRQLVAIFLVVSLAILGGVLGWSAGVVMDRYPALGLGPVEFWNTDPENVWAWGFIIGASLGLAAGLAVVSRWLNTPHPDR